MEFWLLQISSWFTYFLKTKCESQTLANTSTWYRYSSIRHFINYLCMNLCKITLKYLFRTRFEYLFFRQIWWIHVKANWISSNYLCFSPFVVHSSIIFQLWCIKPNLMNKYSLNNSKMAEYYSIFGPNAIQSSLRYSLRGQILQLRIITFLLGLLFNLGYRGLLFTSTMNLEGGPRFAGIWCIWFFGQTSWFFFKTV